MPAFHPLRTLATAYRPRLLSFNLNSMILYFVVQVRVMLPSTRSATSVGSVNRHCSRAKALTVPVDLLVFFPVRDARRRMPVSCQTRSLWSAAMSLILCQVRGRGEHARASVVAAAGNLPAPSSPQWHRRWLSRWLSRHERRPGQRSTHSHVSLSLLLSRSRTCPVTVTRYCIVHRRDT